MPYTRPLLAFVMLFGASTAHAQLSMPRASPWAQVTQRVGFSEVTVTYHSPAVKKRTVFGGLVPWDKVWRTGANEATTIKLSTDATIGGKRVPAGTYALFTLPRQSGQWDIIINGQADQWGAYRYNPKTNIVVVKVKADTVPSVERMAIGFANTTDTSTQLTVSWATTRVALPLKFDTARAAAQIIPKQARTWKEHMAGTEYLFEVAKNPQAALKLADRWVALKATWFNYWVRAQIHAALKDKPKALADARKAQSLAGAADNASASDKKAIADAVKRWSK